MIQLGRWSINYNENQLNHKIYLANHDNCGPCGDHNPEYYKNYPTEKNRQN